MSTPTHIITLSNNRWYNFTRTVTIGAYFVEQVHVYKHYETKC